MNTPQGKDARPLMPPRPRGRAGAEVRARQGEGERTEFHIMGKIVVEYGHRLRVVVDERGGYHGERKVSGCGWTHADDTEGHDMAQALCDAAATLQQTAQDVSGNSSWTTEEILAREG